MATNAMQRYEALLLAVPEVTADETSTLESQLHDVISKNKGETLSFDRWGKYRLAYAVRKNEYGVYFLARFEIPTKEPAAVIEKLRQLFAVKYNDIVMRHVVARLDNDASLEYKRPESLEETPRRDVDSFRRGAGPRRDSRRSFDRSAERSDQQERSEVTVNKASKATTETDNPAVPAKKEASATTSSQEEN